MAEVTMPRLSDTMSEGAVGKWLKQPGDKVEADEIIAEIETDKATMELVAFESGYLQQILVGEGETVPIGTPIAMIGASADGAGAGSAPAAEAPSSSAPASAAQPSPSEEGGAEATERVAESDRAATQTPEQAPQPSGGARDGANGQGEGGRIKASPLARKLAEERGVDLRQIQGTGPGGRIIRENVESFVPGAAAPQAQPAAPATQAPAPQAAAAAAPQAKPAAPAPNAAAEPLGRMRKAIARAMNESKPGVPHIYVTVEVDMAAAMALRKQINDSGAGVKVSVNDLVVKAAAKALTKLPAVNTSFATTGDGQPGVVKHAGVNVSVAVALEDGLIAPVVKDADKKSIGTIASEVKDMAGRAREGKIKQNELEGATFQVTNLGMYGVVEFGSIITVPQAASLAVGAVREVPVVREGQVVVGQVMNVTLSADHRIVDGAVAAQYLAELRKLLEAPMSLLV
jgi:pyruvate dehydrogenase E2 component (dihydrolipoamide acetyltransferase)